MIPAHQPLFATLTASALGAATLVVLSALALLLCVLRTPALLPRGVLVVVLRSGVAPLDDLDSRRAGGHALMRVVGGFDGERLFFRIGQGQNKTSRCGLDVQRFLRRIVAFDDDAAFVLLPQLQPVATLSASVVEPEFRLAGNGEHPAKLQEGRGSVTCTDFVF